MAEAKTKKTPGTPKAFLAALPDAQQREDSLKILAMMQKITGEQPYMWAASMIGFGTYHYKYESGREGDCFMTGFSPRKDKLSLYITSGFDQFPELMAKLGKYKTGKSCLYIKKLDDIDVPTLQKLIKQSYALMKKKHGK
jgi:hypothetical protein